MGYSSIKNISTGWLNVMKDSLGNLPAEIKQLSLNRLSVCEQCPLRTSGLCDGNKSGRAVRDFQYKSEWRRRGGVYNGCGCPLTAKTKVPAEKCPLGKW